MTDGPIPKAEPRENEKIVHTFEEWDPDGKWDWDHCSSITDGPNIRITHIPREWVEDILQRVGISVFKERRFRTKAYVSDDKSKGRMLSRKKF